MQSFTCHFVAVQYITAFHQTNVFTLATPFTSFDKFIACHLVVESMESSIHMFGVSVKNIQITLSSIFSTFSNSETSACINSVIWSILSWTTSFLISCCGAGVLLGAQSMLLARNTQKKNIKTQNHRFFKIDFFGCSCFSVIGKCVKI